jgi:excisionase family DNA binding protein
MSPLLKAQDVARELNITPGRAYEIGRRGILPCVRIGKQMRFTREALDAFVRAGGRPEDS